ncbi:MAG TPA: iron uptake transporter permease EfeU [Mycobacteriales bacterium]|nr:iron uptake transporter permease EfeU [Mycobacteriales bacterium]
MLPTFVIGLREGLEAALIVGIIAAFLRKQGRLDLLRWVYVGVGTAIALCVGVGVALRVLSDDLPQRQQEGLETIVGALAVGMVTYMVVWMRRHSRDLKGTLEGATAEALRAGSDRAGKALVLMAFLAVLREGFETVVFLLAAFNETGSGASPVAGAIIGIVVAVGLGWGIYRGGVKLNLSKFFRATGLVLVLVAAGLVMTAIHTAHEAGWLDVGQHQTFDMSWLVRPGSIRASLLTGILGLQPQPVVIELVGWLVYLVPVAAYVGWPQGRRVPMRVVAWSAAATAVAAAAAAGVLAGTAPGKPPARPLTAVGDTHLQVVSALTGKVTVRMPAGGPSGQPADVTLTRLDGSRTVRDGVSVVRYVLPAVVARSGPDRLMTAAALARLNGGRLPLGVTASGRKVAVTFRSSRSQSVDVTPGSTNRVVDASWERQVIGYVHTSFADVQLSKAVSSSRQSLPAAAVTAAFAAARHDASTLDRRDDDFTGAAWLTALAGVMVAVGVACGLAGRRRPTTIAPTPVDGGTGSLVQHQVSLT